LHLDHCHQVQPEEEKVHEVIFGEIFSGKVGVNAADAPQPTAGGADVGQGRDDDLFMIADNNREYLAGAVNEDAYLSAGFFGKITEGSGQFRSNDLFLGNLAVADFFKTP
jgi:hypothetical protein